MPLYLRDHHYIERNPTPWQRALTEVGLHVAEVASDVCPALPGLLGEKNSCIILHAVTENRTGWINAFTKKDQWQGTLVLVSTQGLNGNLGNYKWTSECRIQTVLWTPEGLINKKPQTLINWIAERIK